MPQTGKFGNDVDGHVILGEPILAVMSGGAVGIGVGAADYGEPLFLFGEVVTTPSSSGFEGGFLYVENRQLVWLGQLGTRTVIGGVPIATREDRIFLPDRVAKVIARAAIDNLGFIDTIAIPRSNIPAEDGLEIADEIALQIGEVTEEEATDTPAIADAVTKVREVRIAETLALRDADDEVFDQAGERLVIPDLIGTEHLVEIDDDTLLLDEESSAAIGEEIELTDTLVLNDDADIDVDEVVAADGLLLAEAIDISAPGIEQAESDGVVAAEQIGKLLEKNVADQFVFTDASARDLAPTLAWWEFEEGSGTAVSDSVGPHDATLQNGVGWTTGQIGTALDLDGSDDRMVVDTNTNIEDLAEFTYCCWIYAHSDGDREIISKRHSYHEMRLRDTGPALKLRASVTRATANDQANSADGTISLNTWHHVAVTYSVGSMNLYIDGSEPSYEPGYPIVGSGSILADSTYPQVVGARRSEAGAFDRHFDGLIDDVRIYGRKLTAQEIADIYQAGGGT